MEGEPHQNEQEPAPTKFVFLDEYTSGKDVIAAIASSQDGKPGLRHCKELASWDEIETYVENSFKRFEANDDLHSLLFALNIISSYPEYFDEIPEALVETILNRLQTGDHEYMLMAIECGGKICEAVDLCYCDKIRSNRGFMSYSQYPDIEAYIVAKSGDDEEEQLKFLSSILSST